jgi:hypothetical protein
MTMFVVIATGESLTPAQVSFVHEKFLAGLCNAVAVSNSYERAPWAAALVSNDRNWWVSHPQAAKFAGRKFCSARVRGLEHLPFDAKFGTGVNSGLQGMRVAILLGATRLALLGFDMHGSHYFGKHPAPLRNTTPQRFKAHIAQFRKWRACPVINCTPGSALKQFPFLPIEEALADPIRQAIAS